jgi:hypothetical protein
MSTSNASAPDEDPEYEVEFTSEQAGAPVPCNKCHKTFPPGTLKLLHSKMHGGSDRLFCSDCFEYYINKKTTIRRTQGLGTSKQGTHDLSLRHVLGCIPHSY